MAKEPSTATKADVIDEVADKRRLPRARAELIVGAIVDAMVAALQRGEGIEIRGFGTFTIRAYKSYEGRNPRTGKQVLVAPKLLPFFRVGKELRARVDRGHAIAPGPATPAAGSIPAPSAPVALPAPTAGGGFKPAA